MPSAAVASGGSGGTSGTINAGTTGQLSYYSAATSLSGISGLTTDGGNNLYAVNISSTGTISASTLSATALNGVNISATNIAGTLSTAAQSNITSVGTLTGLTVAATISASGISTSIASLTTATFGQITAGNISPTSLSIGANGSRCVFTGSGGLATTGTDFQCSSGSARQSSMAINVAAISTGNKFEVSGTVSVTSLIANGAVSMTSNVRMNGLALSAGLDYLCMSTTTSETTYNTTTCTVSDRKYKKNIADANGLLDIAMQLRPRNYDWKDGLYPNAGRQLGFIAQEIQPILPSLVGKGSNGDLSVDYAKMSTVAIGAIQELQGEIDELRALNGLPPHHVSFGQRLHWLLTGE